MKYFFIKIQFLLILICLLTFSTKIHANTTVCNGDSAIIVLTGYINGSNIQWEISADLVLWDTIPDAIDDTLNLLPLATRYYRAAVTENDSCTTYYSDTTYLSIYFWTSNVIASNIDTQIVDTNLFASSSKLLVTWNPPPGFSVDHYIITATEGIKNSIVTKNTPFTTTIDTLTGLKSATTYNVNVKACADAGCNDFLDCSNTVTATTDEEYWELQGIGNTVSTLTKIVSDGNTLNYAFQYGSWGPTALNNYIRYYYNPNAGTEKGSKPAISNYIPQTNIDSTAIVFTGLSGYGLRYSGWVIGSNTPKYIGQSQAIPYNGKIFLFFEAQTDDGYTRIFCIDSQDGYEGLDFNSGISTYCTNPSDYITTGGCALKMVLGVQSDTGIYNNPSITDIRQFKIGYKTLDSWLWNGADKTFMTPTFDLDNSVSCGNTYTFTTGYAMWDSTNGKWDLQYNGSCPYLFDGMQAPSIVHLGEGKYKIYFNNNYTLKGVPHDPMTDTKPMKVIYAEEIDGKVDFANWENVTEARNLNYLWPDGTLLTESQESKLDDYHFLAPTNDLDFQVQYTNVSDGTSMPFVSAAILLNP